MFNNTLKFTINVISLQTREKSTGSLPATGARPKTRLQALESAKKSIQALPATGARPKTRLQARTKLVCVSDHR